MTKSNLKKKEFIWLMVLELEFTLGKACHVRGSRKLADCIFIHTYRKERERIGSGMRL